MEPKLLHETDKLSPWQPDQDKLRLAVLGKLLEELGECTAATARCIIQGINESEPVTQKPNAEWLWQELADVVAAMNIAVDILELPTDKMSARMSRKAEHLRRWHKLLTK